MSGCKGQRQESGHGGSQSRNKSGRGGRSNVFVTPQSAQQSKISKSGLCKELDGNIFEYG